MKRDLMKVPAFAVLSVAGFLLLSGCSGGEEDVEAPPSDAFGSVTAELQIDSTVMLSEVAYVITGPAAFSKSDTLSVQNSATISAVIGPIPAGPGYSIVLTSTSADDTISCAGTAAFTVAAGASTPVFVSFTCHEASQVGSVLLNGSLNLCPVIVGVTASPGVVRVGYLSQLSGAAQDLDDGPSPLSYSWTTDFGTLSDGGLQAPTLTCTDVGTAHVTLTVSDGDPVATCADTRTMLVTCIPAGTN